MVDGGSTDGSIDLLRSYGNRLNWLSEPDAGQSAAINKGWRLGQGEIIAWLNSDDLLYPGALQRVGQAFTDQAEIGFLYGDCDFIDAAGQVTSTYPSRSYDYRQLLFENYIPQPTVFMRRNLLESVGWLDETLHYGMDYDYWLRAGLKHPAAYLPTRLAALRLHPEAKSSAHLAQFAVENARIFERLFGQNDLPGAVAAEKNAALSSIYWRAADCSFWGGNLKQARFYAWKSWRGRPARVRSLWLWLALGPVGRKWAEKLYGNPYFNFAPLFAGFEIPPTIAMNHSLLRQPVQVALLYDHTLHVGGVESYLLEIVRLADRKEFYFTVFSETTPAFAERAAALGARVIPWRRWLPGDLGAPFALARAFRQQSIDLVHCQAPIAAIWGRVAAHLAGVATLETIHLPMEEYHGSGTWLRARLGRWFYTLVDTSLNYLLNDELIYVSEKVCFAHVERHRVLKSRTRVIYPGIDLSRFSLAPEKEALRAALHVPGHQFVIVCVGRLALQKGQDILLAAASSLARQGFPFHLWLVGDGPERQNLESQAASLGLAHIVTFWGFQTDIPSLLQAADLFVLPSRYEAAPLAVLEALAAGLPVIASRVGEIPAWISDGIEGWLVTPGELQDLTEALQKMLANPQLIKSMAAAALQKREQFRAETMVNKILDRYRASLRS